MIKVFSASGALIENTTDCVIPMLQHGFYIVTVDTRSFKIML